MSTGASAAAAALEQQQRFSSISKRKSAVELLAESRAAFYSDKLRDQSDRPDHYTSGRDEDRTSSNYVLVSPSRSLPHPLLPRRHSAFSRLPPFSGSSADNSPSLRGPNTRTAATRVPKSLNASPRNGAQFNSLTYTADLSADKTRHIIDNDLKDLSYNKNANLAYIGKIQENVLFSNSSYKNKRINNNSIGSINAGYSGNDLQNKLRQLLGCDATERRRSLIRSSPGAPGDRNIGIKEPSTFRSGVGSCEDLLLGGAISPPAEYASSPQVLKSARYKGQHQHHPNRSHHSRKSQKDEGFHESHKSLPDLYARTRADEEELLNRQRGYDITQYYDESSSPQEYDRPLYREGNRSSGVYKSNSSCNRSNSSCNRSNSSCNRSTSSCNNRDSGGSSGHFTHSRSSEHTSTLPPISATNHNPNLLTEPYRRDSGSSTQHSYDNSFHSINHIPEYISHKCNKQEDYTSLDYRTDYNSSRYDQRYKADHSYNKYNLSDHKVYNTLNYKTEIADQKVNKYNHIRLKPSDHKPIYNEHRSNYYQPDHNQTHFNMSSHHDGYHSGRYMPVNRNLGIYERDICCDDTCLRDGQSLQYERDCVECQRMLYEHRQHQDINKKKKNQTQYEMCDCDPATVFQVPEQFQDDYIQENKHNSNIFSYEHTTYLTTMTTTMTTDYRKDFHNSGASSLPPLNEGFVQNEKSRKPDDGFIRETFISTPLHREDNKEKIDGFQGGPLSPPLGTFKRQRCLRYKNKCSTNSSGRERDSKPVLRSKSDISDRYCNSKGEKIIRCRSAQQPTPPSPLHHQTTSKSIDSQMSRVEDFFDRLGLSDDTFEQLMSDGKQAHYSSMGSPNQDQINSPPVFFSDASTVDSLDQCVYDYTNTGSNNAPVQNVVRVSEPPSVVERNARIIKWLCNCRKMQLQ